MLSERYANRLGSILVSQSDFHPHPTLNERRAWEALPEQAKQQTLQTAQEYVGWQWPALPATLFMEYRRNGNRDRYQHPYFARRAALSALVLAECIEAKGVYLDDIINGIWCICEESFWGIPAHSNVKQYPGAPLPDTTEPIIDLFAAETAALLAWTHYLLHDQLDGVTPVVSARIEKEMAKRLFEPYLSRNDFWWMGLDTRRTMNNWTPWCTSNCLLSFLLLEKDMAKRTAAVDKALRSLDRYIEDMPEDGGCDEGPSYWNAAGGALFDCLELLAGATGGAIDVYSEPIIADIGRYIYRAYIDRDYYVNFADCAARVNISAPLVYQYGRRINDQHMTALGVAAYKHKLSRSSLTGMVGRRLSALFYHAELETQEASAPFVRDTWLPKLQFMTTRLNEGNSKGLFLAAKGGHNHESHNHNDVGNFIVYADGKPVLIDVGVETYTAKTFSDLRYTIWTMQSAYHNLPTVNGAQQQAGGGFKASEVQYFTDDNQAELSLEIGDAYPQEAGIENWHRFIRLERSGNGIVVVRDEFALQQPSEVTLSLMTLYQPNIQAGIVELPEANVRIECNPTNLRTLFERIDLSDKQLKSVWGDHIYRINISAPANVQHGTWQLRITMAS